jgi:hypothetical protein
MYVKLFPLSEAFGDLKNSEFYKKPDEACSSKATPSGTSKAVRPSGTKSNPILVSPRQVIYFYLEQSMLQK